MNHKQFSIKYFLLVTPKNNGDSIVQGIWCMHIQTIYQWTLYSRARKITSPKLRDKQKSLLGSYNRPFPRYGWLNAKVDCSYQSLAFNFGEACSWLRFYSAHVWLRFFTRSVTQRSFSRYIWSSLLFMSGTRGQVRTTVVNSGLVNIVHISYLNGFGDNTSGCF